MTLISKMFLFVFAMFILAAVYGLAEDSIQKETKMMCYKYQMYAVQYPDFWVSTADKMACDVVGIKLNVVVK